MIKFAMKGNTSRQIHGAHSISKVQFRGHFSMQGSQPVGEQGGAPQWVADLFDQYPNIEQVAISTKSGGSVWSRMDGESNED